jgi:hypothetical protein
VPPHVELTQGVEQPQVPIEADSFDTCRDRATKRDDAERLRPFRRVRALLQLTL